VQFVMQTKRWAGRMSRLTLLDTTAAQHRRIDLYKGNSWWQPCILLFGVLVPDAAGEEVSSQALAECWIACCASRSTLQPCVRSHTPVPLRVG
jgi:hypothetical protein